MDPFRSSANQAPRLSAEELAIKALAFIGGEPTRLERFLALTGYNAGNIRTAAADPAFLAGVLGHLLEDEPLLLDFAANESVRPEEVVTAAQSLGVTFGA